MTDQKGIRRNRGSLTAGGPVPLLQCFDVSLIGRIGRGHRPILPSQTLRCRAGDCMRGWRAGWVEILDDTVSQSFWRWVGHPTDAPTGRWG